MEFYRKFWSLISESYVRCTNECFERGEMTHSQKQAVITLIEKKRKDRSLLESWRPISLVNVFFFLWKGIDKVKRVTVINEHEEGGLRMIDLECMMKSLRLAWLRQILNEISGP